MFYAFKIYHGDKVIHWPTTLTAELVDDYPIEISDVISYGLTKEEAESTVKADFEFIKQSLGLEPSDLVVKYFTLALVEV